MRHSGHPLSSEGSTIETDFLGPLLWIGTLSSELESTSFSSSGTWTRFALPNLQVIENNYVQ